MAVPLKIGLEGFTRAQVRAAGAVRRYRRQQAVAVRRTAGVAQKEIVKGLRSGSPGGKRLEPLSPLTRLLSRTRRPLRELAGEVTVVFGDRTPPDAFVGIPKTARAEDGTSLADVASIHEVGSKSFTIPVTQEVRDFFVALSIATNGRIKPLTAGKTTITHPGVPKRPFVRPAIAKAREKLQKVLRDTVVEQGGPF